MLFGIHPPLNPFFLILSIKLKTLKELVFSIAKTLLQKNIPFSIYRYPGEIDIRLAIDPELLPHPPENTWWMAPFTNRSAAKDIFLSVVNKAFVDDSLLDKLVSLPARNPVAAAFPAASTQDEYFERLNGILTDIRTGRNQKVIMSRVFYEGRPDDFDAVDTFKRLAANYPATFTHLSLHPESGIWLGATPELLLKQRDASLSIMALAGTQARKDDGEYRWREKEMEEHLMVGRHIEKIFKKYGCSLSVKDGPKTIESGRVAHLSTDYVFQEEAPVAIKDLLQDLHPTPAVGGLPVDISVESILEHEGYDRRYYCGFVGETDFQTTADLYINLRCMQVGGDRIAIYVGGGITAASNPQEEWQETVMKSKTMVDILNPVKAAL